MDDIQTIMTYKAILTTTGKMLIAAQNNEWDELISLEQECRRLAEILTKEDPEPILDKELLQKKVKIIHQILNDDAQIRAITEPWMMRLQDLLSTSERTRNLQQTYQLIGNT
ncbi:flagellar protein FliT [Nitrosomonas sp. Nm166]|uniref:flagellar protein FliT n=1 Tax=Nitrosomonas sp. Nm166 TaxID=1881054 RepID=UPI0008ED9906|nr:flagellar protein FliT [Nitrosomonas sp. Nm166]SFD90514.1 flagellar protein FliT [Nitrosomonas sp. Nm166]